ncbi:hypothetical protein VP01_965g2, partial [Puccinia sorghi]
GCQTPVLSAAVLMLKGLQEITSGKKKSMTTAAPHSNASNHTPARLGVLRVFDRPQEQGSSVPLFPPQGKFANPALCYFKQDAAFHNQHLVPNYREDIKVMPQLDNLMGNQLKANKNQLATVIKAGLAITDPPTPVPRLGMLVANVYSTLHLVFCDVPLAAISQDGRIMNGAKMRLAYIRLMITHNQLERARNAGANTPTFWNQIDDNAECATHQLLNLLSLSCIDDVSLPTEAEIQAERP